ARDHDWKRSTRKVVLALFPESIRRGTRYTEGVPYGAKRSARASGVGPQDQDNSSGAVSGQLRRRSAGFHGFGQLEIWIRWQGCVGPNVGHLLRPGNGRRTAA